MRVTGDGRRVLRPDPAQRARRIEIIEADAVADVNTLAVDIDLPAVAVTQNQNGAFQPDLEAYEGMLVRIPETLTISEQFNLDRFNEIKLAAGERPVTFTHENEPRRRRLCRAPQGGRRPHHHL